MLLMSRGRPLGPCLDIQALAVRRAFAFPGHDIKRRICSAPLACDNQRILRVSVNCAVASRTFETSHLCYCGKDMRPLIFTYGDISDSRDLSYLSCWQIKGSLFPPLSSRPTLSNLSVKHKLNSEDKSLSCYLASTTTRPVGVVKDKTVSSPTVIR